MGEQTSKYNVLFIGNGLDRLAGYNTDYPSFLWSYLNHYTAAIKKKAMLELGKKKFFDKRKKEIELDVVEYVNKLIYDEEPSFDEIEHENIYYSRTNNNLNLSLLNVAKLREFSQIDKFLFNLPVEELQKNRDEPDKINYWIVYFIYIMLSGAEKGQNWTDLEEVIFKNSKLGAINDQSDGLPSYEKVIRELGLTPGNKLSEFKEMKRLLTIYLKIEKDRDNVEKICSIGESIYKYGTILNFNYGTTYCIPKAPEVSEFWIHGDLKDKENIVFGYDDGMMVEKNIENRYASAKGSLYQYKNELHKQFSKTHQLLNLTTFYQAGKTRSGIRLPLKKDVRYVGILGHGIGAADYNYFETLCDFDNVKIEVFWYEFSYIDTAGEKIESDNKAQLQQSVMKMLQEMEKRLDKVLAHRMLIEQRIIFTKLDYEKI